MGGGSDVFSAFFGGEGGRRGPSGPRKGNDCVHSIEVNLADCYNGGKRKFAITRQVQANEGEKPVQCRECKGRGVVIRMRQLGPGFVQQMQSQCSECNGVGSCVKMKQEKKKTTIQMIPSWPKLMGVLNITPNSFSV